MEIILKEAVDGLGNIGDLVKVKPGFARNYLLPQGFAVEASNRNVKELEHQKRVFEHKRFKLSKDAEGVKARIEAHTNTFSLKAGEEGKLFGSVTAQDIADNLEAAGIKIDRKKLQLDDAIKNIGEFSISYKLPAQVVAQVKVVVTAEEE